MVVEKRIASHGTGTADSDIDPASQVTPTRMPSAPPMITIGVDGFRVTYLKYGTKLAFRLDTDVLRFIPGYLYLQAMKFRASPPRNLGYQKVHWNKDEARWDVYLSTGEQLSGPCVDGLSVDKSLPFEEFLAQKMSSHQRAIDLWNEKDATNRRMCRNKAQRVWPARKRKSNKAHVRPARKRKMDDTKSQVVGPAESNEAACN
jgi:hypothetical protein